MNGETEKDVSGLTTETLKLLMDTEFRRSDERFAAFLEVYRRDQEKANEFRSALDDLSKSMATRRELEATQSNSGNRIDALVKDIGDLRSRLDVGPVGLGQLQTYQAQQSGRQEGARQSQATLYAMLAAFGTVIGLIVILANVLTK